MRYLHSTLWLLLGAAWISALFALASTVGGTQWLAHMGRGTRAALNILLASLCLAIAGCAFSGGKAPKVLLFSALTVALLHLFNGLGSYLMVTLANNGIGAPLLVMMPFYLVGSVIPTNPIFASGLIGNWQLIALPLASTVLALLQVLPRYRERNGRARN